MILETMKFMKKIKVQFGFDHVVEHLPTLGMSDKGGMEKEEFSKSPNQHNLPLSSCMKQNRERIVMIKVDSGPGWVNTDLMAYLPLMGFYTFQCVPNTMAVTQDAD